MDMFEQTSQLFFVLSFPLLLISHLPESPYFPTEVINGN